MNEVRREGLQGVEALVLLLDVADKDSEGAAELIEEREAVVADEVVIEVDGGMVEDEDEANYAAFHGII